MPYNNFQNISTSQLANPPLAGAFRQRPTVATSFRKFYERGDFPIALEHDTKGNRIAWKVLQFLIVKISVILFVWFKLIKFITVKEKTQFCIKYKYIA